MTQEEETQQGPYGIAPHAGPFGIIPTSLLADQRLSAEAVRVYGLLASHADQRGECCPKLWGLGKTLGVGESTVSKRITELEAAGYVRSRRAKRNHYVLLFTAWRAAEKGKSKTSDRENFPPRKVSSQESFPAENFPPRKVSSQESFLGGNLIEQTHKKSEQTSVSSVVSVSSAVVELNKKKKTQQLEEAHAEPEADPPPPVAPVAEEEFAPAPDLWTHIKARITARMSAGQAAWLDGTALEGRTAPDGCREYRITTSASRLRLSNLERHFGTALSHELAAESSPGARLLWPQSPPRVTPEASTRFVNPVEISTPYPQLGSARAAPAESAAGPVAIPQQAPRVAARR